MVPPRAWLGNALALVVIAWLALAGGIARASVTVCVESGESLALRVAFDTTSENAVRVFDSAGKRLVGFDNYFSRGAAREWTRGAGDWRSAPQPGRACFRIDGQHKAGPPNAAWPWSASACRVTRGRIGFEAGDDDDYDDARVEVITGHIDAIAPPCRGESTQTLAQKAARMPMPPQIPPQIPVATKNGIPAQAMPPLERLPQIPVRNGPVTMHPEPMPTAKPEIMARTDVDLDRQARSQALERRSAEAALREQIKLLERRSAETQLEAQLKVQREARLQMLERRETQASAPPSVISKSVSRAITSTPPDSPDAEVARIDAYLNSLKSAAYTFNPPSPIQVAKPVTVHFWLDPQARPEDLAAELKAQVPEDAARVEAGTTRWSPQMEATLRGDEFDIKAITPERQPVSAAARTVWEWSVNPKQPGKAQRLYLTLNVVLPEALGGPRTQKTFEKRIDVEVTPLWLFDTYFEKYGTWALGGLGSLLAAVFGWWWKNRRGQG